MDGPTVNVFLPDGSKGHVRAEDLEQALAAGATLPDAKAQAEEDIGGLAGQAATGLLGAARTASFGLSDAILGEAANIAGGAELRKQTLGAIKQSEEVNPYSNMAGEGAGLFVGAGGGLLKAGEGVEKLAAKQLGEGLLGSVGSMGARGAFEGGALGVGKQISEDALGDVDSTAEKLFAAGTKDALLGGAAGAALGALGHYAGEVGSSLVRSGRGRTPTSTLDGLAGVEGAGTALRDEARQAERTVGELQAAGATSDQAARMVDDVNALANARTQAGPASGAIDRLGGLYGSARAGDNAEMREILDQAYGSRAKTLADHDSVLSDRALQMRRDLDKVLRGRDTLDSLQFSQKADQFGRMISPEQLQVARDATTNAMREAEAFVDEMERSTFKGGMEQSVGKLRKVISQWKDANGRLATASASGQARANAARDFFILADGTKRAFGQIAKFGKSKLGNGVEQPAVDAADALYHRFQGMLEDETVWGPAGTAQRELNAAYSGNKGRTDALVDMFGVKLDSALGRPLVTADPGKLRAFLSSVGDEAGSAVSRETMDAFIQGQRDRITAARAHLEMNAAEKASVDEAETALNAFEKTYQVAQKDAAVVNRLRSQQLEERETGGLGGVLGLATDILTRPATTMERLGAVRATAERFEKGVAEGLDRFFKGPTGEALVERLRPAAKSTAARLDDAATAKEIESMRELVGNPAALEGRVSKMVGDLSNYAPKVASSVATHAQRVVTYLATEAAPPPRASVNGLDPRKSTPRFSAQQLSEYRDKRDAALDPRSVIEQMQKGRLNRNAIAAVEATSPRVFAELQDMARAHLEKMATDGTLDKMPYQKKAQLAALLKVAADDTWTGEFIAKMQASKGPPPPPPNAGPAPSGAAATLAARPIKIDTTQFETPSQQIEAGGTA